MKKKREPRPPTTERVPGKPDTDPVASNESKPNRFKSHSKPTLDRQTFTTSRLLEYFSKNKSVIQTVHHSDDWVSVPKDSHMIVRTYQKQNPRTSCIFAVAQVTSKVPESEDLPA
jgi:hypothetical protein